MIFRLNKLKQSKHSSIFAIIDRNINHLIDNTTLLSLSKDVCQKIVKIVDRDDLKRLGRFQHDELMYDVKIVENSNAFVQQVDCFHIFDFVTLLKLERFENAQFEQKLICETSLSIHQKKRERSFKKVFHEIDLFNDDEIVFSDVNEDDVVVIVSVAQKSRRSSSLSRDRDRFSKKSKIDSIFSRFSKRDNVDHEHVALSQMKKRIKNSLSRNKSLSNDIDIEILKLSASQHDEAIDDDVDSFKARMKKNENERAIAMRL